MSFFKTFFASCLGALVATVVLVILGIGIITAMVSSDSEVSIEENSVLHLKLNAQITEMDTEDPLAELFPGAAEKKIGLLSFKEILRRAKVDSSIHGIYLDLSSLGSGISTTGEIRESILDFRKSGKWVIAYSDQYTEGAYYLASAADKVYLNPEGDMEFNGLAVESIFFKKMLDKLEIKPEVFKVGDFKSAVEPFLRENMSDPNRLQVNSMINSIYNEMLSRISESRKIPKDKLKEIADKMLVRNAKLAVEMGLIDSLYYEDQVKDEMRKRLHVKKDKPISFVKYATYKKSISLYKSSPNEIAVIVADGEIVAGESSDGMVGGETMVDAIHKAKVNDKVKAIIIRVNSPGGSFQASDEMWREVMLAAKKKTVIASMGDYAASGGYYLAMACDTIVATPTTLTGSIGIFSVLMDLSGFLGNKIGITTEEVKTGEIGSITTFARPLTDVEKAIWQKKTEEIYEVFTGKAAEGRKMSKDDIKKIASGRVWTGEQAKNNGLVDILGGFDDAVRIAASAAKLGDDYKLKFYPHHKTFLETITGSVEKEARSVYLQRQLGEYYPWFQQFEHLKQYTGVQARIPMDLKVTF
jgi:protease-4